MATSDQEKWISEVAHGGLRTREQAASKLLALDMLPLVDFLLSRIEQKDYAERNAAIELLGRLGPRSWPVLKARVDQLSVEGKMFVAPALAEFHDRRTLPILHAWAESDDPNLSATACEALGDLGDTSSIDVLQRVAKADIWMAGPAISALGRIPDRLVVAFLSTQMQDEDIRPFAVSALSGMPMAEAWPAVCEGVQSDPTLAGIALDDAEPLLKKLDSRTIQKYARPKNSWVFAAREGLKRKESRIAAAILLGALADDGSARRLIDLYLFDVDDDYLRMAIQRLPSSREFLMAHSHTSLGDEATRRLVQLVSPVLGDQIDVLMPYLAHPSPAVRLESVLALRSRGAVSIELLAGLLGDPDELVRKTVLQALRDVWSEGPRAERIAAVLDYEGLQDDVLTVLAQEGPAAVSDGVKHYLDSLGKNRREKQASLHMLLEMRAHPEQVVAQVRNNQASLPLGAEEIIGLLHVRDRSVIELLLEVLSRPDDTLRYLAAETLAAHPLATQTDIEAAFAIPGITGIDGAVAALAAFERVDNATQFARLLSGLSGALMPEAELELLRALRHANPEAGKMRFQKALKSGHWYLQVEAVLGLRACGVGGKNTDPENHLLPQAQEALQYYV